MTSPRHFEVLGVIVYNPEKSLLPSTVVPENFVLTTQNGNTVGVTDVEYYKKKNRVLLYPEDVVVGQPDYQLSANEELKFIDGSTPIITESQFIPSIPITDDLYGVAVTRVTYKKNGNYLYNLSGKTDFVTTFDVVNATGEAQNGVQYTIMTDESGYILEEGNFDIGEDEEITFSAIVNGYIMEPCENVVIVFEDR